MPIDKVANRKIAVVDVNYLVAFKALKEKYKSK